MGNLSPGAGVEWRKILRLSDRHRIGSDGRIWSEIQNKEIGTSRKGHLYRRVSFSLTGPRLLVHLLVAEAFLGPREPGMEVNHKNGDKLDNRVENLEYVTHAENMRHGFATGLMPRGERRGHAKLTESAVREIRREYGPVGMLAGLAKKHGVSNATILAAVRRETWRHVD